MGIFGDGVKVGKFINALSNWEDETRVNKKIFNLAFYPTPALIPES
jgi:hypothetical protein